MSNRGLHAATAAEVRAALRSELDRLEAADPFESLHCAYSAGQREVRKAYLAATQAWHPNRFARRDPDVRALATEVFVKVRKAWDAVCDEAARTKTLSKLGKAPEPETPQPEQPGTSPPAPSKAAKPSKPGRAPRTPSPEAPERHKTPTRDPEPVESESQAFERGRALMRQQRFAAAAAVFRDLGQRHPQSPRYRVHMHYVLGRDHQAANRPKKARAEYERALSLDPDFGRAKTAMETLGPKTKQRGLFSKLFRK